MLTYICVLVRRRANWIAMNTHRLTRERAAPFENQRSENRGHTNKGLEWVKCARVLERTYICYITTKSLTIKIYNLQFIHSANIKERYNSLAAWLLIDIKLQVITHTYTSHLGGDVHRCARPVRHHIVAARHAECLWNCATKRDDCRNCVPGNLFNYDFIKLERAWMKHRA